MFRLGTSSLQRGVHIAGGAGLLVLAIGFAPLALAIAAMWFLWRSLLYATAKQAMAEITGWTGEGDPEQNIEAAVARPMLRFTDHDGMVHTVQSRIGFRVHDAPPEGDQLIVRYHTRPRIFAELDDRSEWFTGPALAVVLALSGTFLAWLGSLLAGSLLSG